VSTHSIRRAQAHHGPERGPRDTDEWHDLAVYVLAGCALGFFTYGFYAALHEIVGALASIGQPTLLATPDGITAVMPQTIVVLQATVGL
jgi:hypothetical protein